jgi:hypothetical protein
MSKRMSICNCKLVIIDINTSIILVTRFPYACHGSEPCLVYVCSMSLVLQVSIRFLHSCLCPHLCPYGHRSACKFSRRSVYVLVSRSSVFLWRTFTNRVFLKNRLTFKIATQNIENILFLAHMTTGALLCATAYRVHIANLWWRWGVWLWSTRLRTGLWVFLLFSFCLKK